jgi:hypothetical protein
MSIDKHIHGKRRLNLVLQGNEATTVPCSACGRSFTAECCRDAMIKLIRHLQENMADVKHRAELEWIKNELFSRKVHRRANRLAHSFHKLCVYSDGFCHRVQRLTPNTVNVGSARAWLTRGMTASRVVVNLDL